MAMFIAGNELTYTFAERQYADPKHKNVINYLGKKHGCHTCGVKGRCVVVAFLLAHAPYSVQGHFLSVAGQWYGANYGNGWRFDPLYPSWSARILCGPAACAQVARCAFRVCHRLLFTDRSLLWSAAKHPNAFPWGQNAARFATTPTISRLPRRSGSGSFSVSTRSARTARTRTYILALLRTPLLCLPVPVLLSCGG